MAVIFGVGMEKTGTHSLARMLDLPHQPDADNAILGVLSERNKRDVASRIVPSVSNLHVHYLDLILSRFPDARFVLTVRDPSSWLRSSWNHRYARPETITETWTRLDRFRKGRGDVAGCLRYWEWHNRTVWDTVPRDRLLVITTDTLNLSAETLVRFAGRAVTRGVREYAGTYADDPLSNLPPDWLDAQVRLCCPSWNRLQAFHAWNADCRHVDWLKAELLSGRHRRVLEIGSFRGWSTRAFLSALAVGAVDEVHLCEPRPTTELESLLAGRQVTLHQRRSVDLLADDGAWDLAFVDGDHSLANVAEETRLLLAARVPALFAHDTAAVAIPDCEGPAHLKQALADAGYHVYEDAVDRPGERTWRGMTFAARDRRVFVAAVAAFQRGNCQSR